MGPIKKLRLVNFKRFKDFQVEFDNELNLLIGDNESGKSSILTAIDIVLSGSRSKIENIGLDSLFNIDAINNFLNSDKTYENLPELIIEVYLNEQNNFELNGKTNLETRTCDGLRLHCKPNDDFSRDIKEILHCDGSNFPFEYYTLRFETFSGGAYSGYRKFIKHILIDNTLVSNEYAVKEYVKSMYNNNVSNAERNKHHNLYRQHKEKFKNDVLNDLNKRMDNYSFTVKTNSKTNLETDLTLSENEIYIENKGKGKQCFIKTEFALKKNETNRKLDVLLIEEPENHLSHVNMKKLISKIKGTNDKQLFIATHNSLISTRLDLRRSILLNSNHEQCLLLKQLPEDTAKFFMKAPDNNILEMILSNKVLLVEGDAEFILMEALFVNQTQQKMEDSDIHIISVDGTSFKRYLDIAKLLKIKTAVIRDNDGDYQKNCVSNYSEYNTPEIKIFFDNDNQIETFEKSIFQSNKSICDELFKDGLKKLTVIEHMLQNKTKVAFELLDKKGDTLIPPNYIKEAVQWIKQ